MKTLFVLSAILISQFSIQAYAANPDQDLIVDMVRERFAASKPATMADMQVGKAWGCVIYSGQRGIMPNYNTIRPNFLFEKTDKSDEIINTRDFPYSIFKMTANGMISKNGADTLYARVARNGALVFENVSTQPKTHKAYRAIADEKLRAIDYVYCK